MSNYDRAKELYQKLNIVPNTSLFLVISPTAYGVYDDLRKVYLDMKSINAWDCCKVYNYLNISGGILKCTDPNIIRRIYDEEYPDLRGIVKLHYICKSNTLTPIDIDFESLERKI